MEQIVTVLQLDSSGKNGVFYPRSVIIDALDDFRSRLLDRNESIPGEFQIPPIEEIEIASKRLTTIMLDRISHFVKAIWIQGDTVYAKIKLVGKYADLANNGVEFSVFPRALGNVDENNRCNAYKLVTLDLCDSAELVSLESFAQK